LVVSVPVIFKGKRYRGRERDTERKKKRERKREIIITG
jgi:hypothetical protein